jgi:hypothetical protein
VALILAGTTVVFVLEGLVDATFALGGAAVAIFTLADTDLEVPVSVLLCCVSFPVSGFREVLALVVAFTGFAVILPSPP